MFYSPVCAKQILAGEIRTSAQHISLGNELPWLVLPAGPIGHEDILRPYADRANMLLSRYASVGTGITHSDCYHIATDLVSIAWEIDKETGIELRKQQRSKR